MSNTEWKNGYDQGFAAGWKAAKADKDLNYQNFPPVYYEKNLEPPRSVYNIPQFSTMPVATSVGQYSGTMADSTTFVFNDTKVLLNEDC